MVRQVALDLLLDVFRLVSYRHFAHARRIDQGQVQDLLQFTEEKTPLSASGRTGSACRNISQLAHLW